MPAYRVFLSVVVVCILTCHAAPEEVVHENRLGITVDRQHGAQRRKEDIQQRAQKEIQVHQHNSGLTQRHDPKHQRSLQKFQDHSPKKEQELWDTITELEQLRKHLQERQNLEHTIAEDLIEAAQNSIPKNTSNLVVDGTPSERCWWPWMVALTTMDGVFVCGGSLVDREYVLTAAHCVNYYFGDVGLYARLGVHNLTGDEPLQTVEVINITMHSRYDPDEHGLYDIALLKLAQPAATDKYPDCIKTIPPATPNITHLPRPHPERRDVKPSNCIILGWGRTDPNSNEISDVLIQKPVVVISNLRCSLAWDLSIFSTSHIYPENICVKSEVARGSTSCQGDSGGPLQCYYEDEGWVLEGVASWGSASCKYYPSVYTRVARFYEWIQAERLATFRV